MSSPGGRTPDSSQGVPVSRGGAIDGSAEPVGRTELASLEIRGLQNDHSPGDYIR